jgi:hypothetical protein
MFTPKQKLNTFKFQYSINHGGYARFTNTVIDTTPSIDYKFAHGNNWTATDNRIKDKLDDVWVWHENFWKTNPKNSRLTYQDLYETDLEKEILDAYKRVNDKWSKKLHEDFEVHYADEVLGFFNGEKQNTKD